MKNRFVQSFVSATLSIVPMIAIVLILSWTGLSPLNFQRGDYWLLIIGMFVLIIGLGTPGKDYESTRHNMGFMAIDTFAERENVSFNLESKFKALLATVTINGNKAILIKPMTYMNLSGEAVAKVMNFYKKIIIKNKYIFLINIKNI